MLSFVLPLLCLLNRSWLYPDGPINDVYTLSRNAFILFIIYAFLKLGLFLIKENKEE
ncbi:hypothetical protein R4Y45_06965 [Holzapfeliella sp. He02]|uniref:Uncharacterized protein n=1 Tax=Holzapfeliella saturejae TaxID=3082953 RepID=A0ABU8SHU6_9LACO